MQMTDIGLNLVLNCDESFRSKTTIDKDGFELSFGDNIADFFLPFDLEVDLKSMLGEILKDNPGVQDQLKNFGMGDLQG